MAKRLMQRIDRYDLGDGKVGVEITSWLSNGAVLGPEEMEFDNMIEAAECLARIALSSLKLAQLFFSSTTTPTLDEEARSAIREMLQQEGNATND